MALENVSIKDAAGDTKKITADLHSTDEYVQVAKLGFGADGDAPTLVSSAAPLPVVGTVTANLGATDNAVLDAIQAAVETIDNAIAGTEMQVDVVASLPSGSNTIGKVELAAGTAAIGKLAANSGVDIGDVDVTSITNGSINGPAAPVVDSYTHAAINLAAGNNQVLVSSSASHQVWVYGIGFTVNAAGTVSFQDEDDTAITGIMPFDAKGGMAISPSGNFAMPIWKLATDKDLEVDIVTSELDGWIDYAIVNA